MAEEERLSIKRKDIDRVNEDFSDFSLSTPARKIRRLDVDLPPIMEEEEVDMKIAEEIEPPSPVIEERAVVLFKPLHYDSPSSGNLFVDADLISRFKYRFLRDASRANDNQNEDQKTSKCQAVVCWTPSQPPYSHSMVTFKPLRTLEITELDETGEDVVMEEAAAMEIEEDNTSTGLCFPQQGHQQHQQQQEDPSYGLSLHQWQQQQNCMTPQLPRVSTTPITWFL